MGTAVKFTSVLLFLTFIASIFYSWSCYERYRDLWPKQPSIGLLTGIARSIRSMNDPHDPNVSDECKMSFRRLKMALLFTAVTMSLIAIFVLAAR
jgi:hypothetical protein